MFVIPGSGYPVSMVLAGARDVEALVLDMGRRARVASRAVAALAPGTKRGIVEAMARALETGSETIQRVNAEDVEAARQAGLATAMIDRLRLDHERVTAMAEGLRQVASLEDPVGDVLDVIERPNGLRIRKVRVPLGVIAMVYESRPNVTADAAALCFKAGNAVILKGGSEALATNQTILAAIREGGGPAGLPPDAIQLVPTADREAVQRLLRLDECIDLVIPRGGEGLIRAVAEHATVPVLKHYKGVCHVFVDSAADLEMALTIVENAKCQRPGVCNALETLLVHEAIAARFLPAVAERLAARGVELRGDEVARSLLSGIATATEEDWSAEYLDLILAIRVVRDLEAAIDHIERYGSHHSDVIVTGDGEHAARFTQAVDSATVYVNASSRFTDGGEFGMGAEIGISTDKLHARGPCGIEELTTYKYVIEGTGQIRP
jgi:glutamate-5-semialdehyde dehydrogenase